MLILHRSSRGDLLVDRLAEVLAVPPEDPFTPEVVAVPTRGVERWLTQRLSLVLGASPGVSETRRHRDGVSANIEFPFPAALIGEALASATGLDPRSDPWAPDRAVWPLLDVVDDCLDEEWMRTLAAHLGHVPGRDGIDEARHARRWATVRHLADLFDHYGVHRPGLIRSWAVNSAGDRDLDASGRPLPEDLAWQAVLWRELRARIGTPSPPERLEPSCERLRDEPNLIALPERLSLFGLTRLSASYLEVLRAVAVHRDVHLWLLHPSERRWSRTAAALGPWPIIGPRRHDAEADRSGHPLLVTWGRDAREMQAVLAASPADPGGGSAADDVIGVPHHPDTLLGRLQAAVRADAEPPGSQARADDAPDPRVVLDPADRSLRVHACHGHTRQVEVLRDVILGLLEDDPTLEPRDVIVMCPDIDTFAPLIQAAFGPGQEVAGHDLHVRLADRSLRQTNPILTVVSQLLELAGGRFAASAVADFAGSGPVRRRFHFDDDDLSRLEEWVRTAGIRWGLDADGRAPFHLASIGAGTWEAGLDRLLLGVAMSEDDLRRFGGVLPVDDIGSGEVERLGRLAELVDRLSSAVEAFGGTHPLDEWLELIASATDDLAATAAPEAWQRQELQAVLTEVVEAAEASGQAGARLSLGEVRSLLAHRLQGRPTRANFRTGHLTMCTLVPMRSVPHRVVCLLGLDEGTFPRHPSTDGDDLLARDPWVGDRDARSEDRQLLLDALLAAGQHLVITYAGRDERTNASRPPSVPVGELLDVIDASARSADGRAARHAVLIEHPLQSWDFRNFAAGGFGTPGLASFDSVALEGARMSLRPRTATIGLADALLPLEVGDTVELDDLIRFVQHPVRGFLQQRLGIRLPEEGVAPEDGLPVVLDGLQRWAIGDRLLAARLAGADRAACRAAELARGDLPPLRLGEPILDQLMHEVDALVLAAGGGAQALGTRDVTVEIDGRTLAGTVSDLDGDQLTTVIFSRLAPRYRLAAWIRLLAVSAADPERPWHARSVGMGDRRSVAMRTLPPIGSDPSTRSQLARTHLRAIIDLYDRGRAEALPLFCKTSEAWASAARRGKPPVDAARSSWVTAPGAKVPGEDDDRAHVLVFARRHPFDELLGLDPRPGEDGEGWDEAEPTRLGRLARRLWDPLLLQEAGR
jgi:exodeoxyribonuclease V gamma subunit